MTLKSQARRYYREYREAGYPFILAQKLAKLRAKFRTTPQDLEQALKVPVETVVLCECCGPGAMRFTYEGTEYQLDYYSLYP